MNTTTGTTDSQHDDAPQAPAIDPSGVNAAQALAPEPNEHDEALDLTQGMSPTLSANLHAIVAALVARRIAQVTLEYSGSGDSGDSTEITARDADDNEIDLDSHATVESRSQYRDESALLSLHDALDVVFEDVLDWAGHSGWENNSGGEGTLMIGSDGSVELDHSDFYTEVDRDERSFRIGPPSHEAVAA